MKFIIERKYLLQPLRQVSRLVVSRPILPILNNLLLQVTKNTLSLIGTDLEIEMVVHIALSLPHEQGEVTVHAHKFFDICRALPEDAEITVQLKGDRMLLRSGKSRFSLTTLPSSDFPNLNEWKSEIEFVLPQMTMKQIIEATQFSMANQDVRYYLNGILFEIEGKELRSIATNGHRLAVCSAVIDVALERHSIIVPRKGITELAHMLNNENTPFRLQIGKNNICAHINNFSFTSKLIDGHFPDYRLVLSKSSKKTLEINRDSLKQALLRVAVLSNERSRGVRLCFKKNQLKIIANNPEQEEAEEILDAVYTDSEMEIGFNVNYLLDILNVIKSENVRILLSDSMSSIQVEDTNLKNSTYIVMPMRL